MRKFWFVNLYAIVKLFKLGDTIWYGSRAVGERVVLGGVVVIGNLKDAVVLLGSILTQISVLNVLEVHHLFGHHFVVIYWQEAILLELLLQVGLDLALRRLLHRKTLIISSCRPLCWVKLVSLIYWSLPWCCFWSSSLLWIRLLEKISFSFFSNKNIVVRDQLISDLYAIFSVNYLGVIKVFLLISRCIIN